jgi:hypothetical protein
MFETVNMPIEEINKIRDTLVETYEALSTQQIKIAKEISNLNYRTDAPLSQRIGIKGFSEATIKENGIIKIVVNRTPEKVKLFNRLGTQYYKEIKDFWEGSILNALQSITIQPFNEKAFIIVNILHTGDDWDTDNHSIKFIIDAIRYSGVIKNDTYKDVSYTVTGQKNKAAKTVIYISKGHQYIELYKKTCLNITG